MICGRFETLSPRNESMAIVASTPTRSYSVCPAAGVAPSRRSNATPALRMDFLQTGLARLRDHARKRRRERADHLGVKLRAGKPPELLQRLARRARVSVGALRG